MDFGTRGTLIDGKYSILAKLREGGMGAIYKVHHNLLDEVRVIKVMRAQAAEQDEMRRRFGMEAKMVTRLKHHNIASVYDFAIDDGGTAYIVMEYVDGVNLADVMRAVPGVPIALALDITRQALDALSYLHRKNIAHRDISPDNIMITDEDGSLVVKLIDLGIAKNLAATATITRTGLFLGKLKYASPEQLGVIGAGETIDGRSDLYSLGVVLYQLLTNRTPIVGETAQALIAGHLFHEPLSFDESDPGRNIPNDLRAVVMRALHKRREERWATADEFRDAIVAIERQLPHEKTPDAVHELVAKARAVVPEIPPDVTPSAQERVAKQFSPDHTTARTQADTVERAAPTELQPTISMSPAEPTAIETVITPAPPRPARITQRMWLGALAAVVVIGIAIASFIVRGTDHTDGSTGPKTKTVPEVARQPPTPLQPPGTHIEAAIPPAAEAPVVHAGKTDDKKKKTRSNPAAPAAAEKPPETTASLPQTISAPTPPAPAPPVFVAPPPAIPTPVTPKQPSDEDRIRRVIGEFVHAQQSLDSSLYSRVFPAADADRVQRSFAQLRSQDVALTITELQVNGNRATVHATESRTIVPKAGAEQHMSRNSTIILEKHGDDWVISALR